MKRLYNKYECLVSRKVTLIGKKNIKMIYTPQIICIKTYQRYTLIASKTSEYLTIDSLKSLEARLPQYFFRANYSTLINLLYIKEIKNGNSKCIVTLANNETIHVSRRRITAFIKQFRITIISNTCE